MKTTKTIKSEVSNFYRIVMGFGVLLALALIIAFTIAYLGEKDTILLNLSFLILAIFFLFGFLNELLNPTLYEFSKDKIVRKSRFGKKEFLKSEIEGYRVKKEKSKYGSYNGELLQILTAKKTINIDSKKYANFEEMARFARRYYR